MTERALHEFLSRIVVLDSGCWVLNKAKHTLSDGKGAKAVVYRHFIDNHPPRGLVKAKCGNKNCVAPDHLVFIPCLSYLGPDETCRKGHVGKMVLRKDGGRRCKECKRARDRERWHRKKQLDRLSDA